MSRTRIVKGNITEITGGNYKVYSKENIENIGSKVIQVGKEGGVSYGEPEKFKEHDNKTCNYNPPPIGKGTCDYYTERFKNFMKRHPDCLHTPPVYYYGSLRDIKEKGKLSEYEKTIIRLKALAKMRLSIFGDVNGHVEIEAAERQRLKEDNMLPQYVKGNRTVIPTPHASYGYKYCTAFTNELMPKLTKTGQDWLKKAKMDLQTYMEQGVVDKKYISKYNKPYNKKNKFYFEKGKLKGKINHEILVFFYNNIELNNTKFQSFAFATHPDAYNPESMSKLPVNDLIRILLTPEIKEWVGTETWEQAWIMAKNMNYESVTKSTWVQLKEDTRKIIEKQGNKLKHYWDEIFK
jgi:hypothetical protein